MGNKFEVTYHYTHPDSQSTASALHETYDLDEALKIIESLMIRDDVWDVRIDRYD